MTKLRQAQLKSDNIGMTCWIDDKPSLKNGIVISLKTYIEPDRKWTIEKLYDTVHEESEFVHNYDNNDYTKHVGLWKKT